MATSINPELLAQILALAQGAGTANNGGQQFSGTGPLQDWTVDTRRDVIGRTGGGGESSTEIYGDPITRLYQQTGHETWGQDTANVFDAQGNYIGPSSGDSEALSLAKFIASAVGGYYGTNALNGAMGGAAAGSAGAGSGGMVNGAFLGEGVASGVGAWDAAAGLGAAGAGGGGAAGLSSADKAAMLGAEGYGAGMTGAETAAYGAGAGSGGGLTMSQIGSGLKTGVDALGGGGGVAALLGGVAGAKDGGDKTQSTNRDPWAPAQDFLKQQIGQGQQLSVQYQAQPFSGAQKAGYNNMASLLDLVNNNAGGLLSGFQANASGANQFQRGNPRGLIGSSFSPTAEQWNPQTYGRFGG